MTAKGKTKARRYALKPIVEEQFTLEVSAGMPEDVIFRFRIRPHMKSLKQNVIDLCQYGFTEMLNNVIDHSQSRDAACRYEQTYTSVWMVVADHGVGIFEKIQKDFGLTDPRAALLELSKGRLTSDKARHTGEGIFYTSRMFDEFAILSGNLNFVRRRKDEDDWLIETEEVKYVKGTVVSMKLSTDADWTPAEIFARYQQDDLLFRRTHVPIALARYPGEQLVSRSQAKRILARIDQFSEVMLDFAGVEQIGQPFADEIFRVFANAHPGTRIGKMIAHARAMAASTDRAGEPPEPD
jgi:anti-sigma regulatory factor (Ser/Thr protein kinase)